MLVTFYSRVRNVIEPDSQKKLALPQLKLIAIPNILRCSKSCQVTLTIAIFVIVFWANMSQEF